MVEPDTVEEVQGSTEFPNGERKPKIREAEGCQAFTARDGKDHVESRGQKSMDQDPGAGRQSVILIADDNFAWRAPRTGRTGPIHH